ncbi:MAG: 50S ribosomal protein L18e [Candidatus Nanoarchaeia archaeon]
MRKMKTNTELKNLVQELKKQGNQANLWRRLATDLEKPTRQKKAVNLNKIDLLSKENETIVVPGKVLGNGNINHKVNVAALNFSAQAALKMKEASCKTYSISELLKNNPEGKNVRIII